MPIRLDFLDRDRDDMRTRAQLISTVFLLGLPAIAPLRPEAVLAPPSVAPRPTAPHASLVAGIPQCTATDGDADWRVDRSARLRVGTAGNRRGHDLLGVVGATRLADGSLVVATAGTSELRFFGPDAAWKHSVGGDGAGPGEFSSLSTMIHYRGDSLATWDERQRRISVFDRTGRLGRSVPFDEMYLTLDGATDDGRFIMHRVEPLGLEARDGLEDIGIAVVEMTADGRTSATLGRVLGYRTWIGRVEGLMMTAEQPLGPTARIAVRGDDVWIGDPGTGRIENHRARADGTRLDRAPTSAPVTPDHVRRAREAYVASLDAELPREITAGLVSAFEQIDLPGTVPPFGQVLADDGGCVWVQSGDPAHADAWEVFSREGSRLAAVSLPAVDRVLEIGPDYVLGSWTDELDVEYVGSFPLDRGGD